MVVVVVAAAAAAVVVVVGVENCVFVFRSHLLRSSRYGLKPIPTKKCAKLTTKP